jgi:hypothetical protein
MTTNILSYQLDRQGRKVQLVQLDQLAHKEFQDLQQRLEQRDQLDQLALVDDLLSPQILLQQFLHLFLVMLGLTQQVGKYMFIMMATGLSLRQVTLGP